MTIEQSKEIKKIKDKKVRVAARKIQTFINMAELPVWKAVEMSGDFDTLIGALKSEDDKADEKIILDVEIRPSYNLDFITENIKFLNELKSKVEGENKDAE